MGLTEPMWVQFIKGLTSLLIAIHSWIIQPRPATSHARLASSRLSSRFFSPVVHQFWPPPWWIFPPQANSLVFEFKFERSSSAGFAAGGCSCRGTYIFTSKPKTSLQLCGRRPNFPDHSILCVELLLIFVGFKKLRQKSSGATKSIYTAFVAARRPCVAPSVWFQLFLQLSICSLSVSLSFLFLLYVSF